MEYKIQEFKPHDYQKFAADFIMNHPISAVILFLGAGKTANDFWEISKEEYEKLMAEKEEEARDNINI